MASPIRVGSTLKNHTVSRSNDWSSTDWNREIPETSRSIAPLMTLMPASLEFPPAAKVYARFASLISLADQHLEGNLGGRLVLLDSLDEAGCALSLGANIAGAALLGIDAHSERLKWGIRHGVCDFLVNHLDEALRILKNELRKKQPASVWLEADAAKTMAEMVERGVQPDILVVKSSQSVHILESRGALLLSDSKDLPSNEISWSVTGAPSLWLPKIDALAAGVFEDLGDARRRWLQYAPRYLGRAFLAQRYTRLHPHETQRFTTLLGDKIAAGEIKVSVTLEIRRGSELEVIELNH